MTMKKTIKAEKFYPIKIFVMGSGKFPIDMLRYDRCVPATESDANGIASREAYGRCIGLIRFSSARRSAPNIARWKSFGWVVGRVEYGDGTVLVLYDLFVESVRNPRVLEYGADITEGQKEGLDWRAH